MWCKFIEAAHLWCKTYEKASTKATEVQDGNNNELLFSSAVQCSCGMQNGRSRLINTTKKGCKAFSSRSKRAPSNQTKSIVVLCHDDKCPPCVPHSPNQIAELKGANYHRKLFRACAFSTRKLSLIGIPPAENKAS